MKSQDVISGLTPLEQAQKIVLDATPVLGLEKIPLLDALGRVLGEDVIVERDNPPWDNSAMDGFAVRWEDIRQEHAIQKPVTLTVIEDVPAGKMPTKTVGPGQAIRIGGADPQGRGHGVEG
jgi:molybdopterin molybdotransferase